MNLATHLSPLVSTPGVQGLCAVLGRDELRLVGGCVRDTLAEKLQGELRGEQGGEGAPVMDIDLCTPLHPAIVLERLRASPDFKAIPTGLAHGTVTARHLASAQSFEITTLRCDQETDGRRATVAFTADWRGDAARRDFTFNAMMVGMDGQLYDYFDGLADLAAGQVRFIGDARTRLREDWLRGLRYLRFWGRFGRPAPDGAPDATPNATSKTGTAAALREAARHLHLLSVERIWREMKGLIRTPRALVLFAGLGFADALELQVRADAVARLSAGQRALDPLDPVAAWALALGPGNHDALARLKASKAEQAWFAAIRAARDSTASVFARQVRFGHRATEVALGQALSAPPPFPICAQDLLDLGFAAGPALGAQLQQLKDHWIASEGQLGRAALIKSIT